MHLTLRGSNVHSQHASAGMPAGAFMHGPCEFSRDGFKEQKVKPTAVHTYLSFPYIKAYNRIGRAQGKMKMQVPGRRQGGPSPPHSGPPLKSWWRDEPQKMVTSAPDGLVTWIRSRPPPSQLGAADMERNGITWHESDLDPPLNHTQAPTGI